MLTPPHEPHFQWFWSLFIPWYGEMWSFYTCKIRCFCEIGSMHGMLEKWLILVVKYTFFWWHGFFQGDIRTWIHSNWMTDLYWVSIRAQGMSIVWTMPFAKFVLINMKNLSETWGFGCTAVKTLVKNKKNNELWK